jgi:hypothetical protein
MSHLTRVKTTLKDPKKLERALIFLGLTYEKNQQINSWNAVPISEFVVTNVGIWNIGFQRNNDDGVYEVIGDSVSWDGVQKHPKLKKALSKIKGDKRREVFMGILQQAAAITTAVIEAENLGHKITISEPDEDGIIRARIEEVYA